MIPRYFLKFYLHIHTYTFYQILLGCLLVIVVLSSVFAQWRSGPDLDFGMSCVKALDSTQILFYAKNLFKIWKFLS